MKLDTLTELNAERAARRPAIVVTDTANGEQRLVRAKDFADDPLRAELAKGRPRRGVGDGGRDLGVGAAAGGLQPRDQR